MSSTLRKKLKTVELELSAFNKECENVQKRQRNLHSEFSNVQAPQKVLKSLNEDLEGFSKAAKKLLQEAKNNKSPLYGKVFGLYEAMSVKPGYEECVAVALKPYLYTLVVNSRQDLETMLDYAKKFNLVDFSCICLEGLHFQHPSPEAETSLLNYVNEHVLASHLLKDVGLQKNRKEIEKSRHTATVTQDGYFSDFNNVLFHFGAEVGENNSILRQAELNVLKQTLTVQQKLLQQEEEKHIEWTRKIAEKQTQRALLDKEMRQKEMHLIQEDFLLQKTLSEVQQASLQKQDLDREEKELRLDLARIELLLNDLQLKHKDSNEERKNYVNKIVLLEKEMEQANQELKSLGKKCYLQEQAYQQCFAEKQKLSQEKMILETREEEKKRLTQKIVQDLEILKKRMESSTISAKRTLRTTNSRSAGNCDKAFFPERL